MANIIRFPCGSGNSKKYLFKDGKWLDNSISYTGGTIKGKIIEVVAYTPFKFHFSEKNKMIFVKFMIPRSKAANTYTCYPYIKNAGESKPSNMQPFYEDGTKDNTKFDKMYISAISSDKLFMMAQQYDSKIDIYEIWTEKL